VGVPAVVGEIVAGVVVGPSVLNLVGSGDQVLRTLGEIGVILLLFEVGLQMDLAELGAVGRASLLVATVGVVTPLLLGIGAMALVGEDFKTGLFVAAALTATSVGITARVFGDLRALATTEARIVLGAAVADDVMGLVVLTIVVRLVTQGSVSILSVIGIVAVAVGFLVIGGLGGLRIAPPLFRQVERLSRSTGTLVALALAFTLAFAQLADLAKLAPIVGAFVAGLALARSDQADRISRELAGVGHLFIPVFFLQIGIDARVGSFGRADVLGHAAVLLAVAIAGKLVSPAGAIGSPGDKLLIGLGMLPRGEVGLIFATIGLQSGVLGQDLYAALLLVVLVTTVVTPQLLKLRYSRLRGDRARAAGPSGDPMPAGGWLEVVDGEVVLVARPPAHSGLQVAFDAAAMMATARPSSSLLDWLSSVDRQQLRLGGQGTAAFLKVVATGSARAWRFLDALGILEVALPELAEALRERHRDPFEVDPTALHRWPTIERLQHVDPRAELDQLAHPEWLFLAALLVDALGERRDRVTIARSVVRRLDLGAAAEQEVALLVGDRDLLVTAQQQPDALSEASVLALASHADTPERARALHLLSVARADTLDSRELRRLDELHSLVQEALAHPDLTGLDARNLVGRRQAAAIRLAGAEPDVIDRIERAPRAYILATEEAAIARHAKLLAEVHDHRSTVRTSSAGADRWLDVVAPDRPGLLAAVTSVLAAEEIEVIDAVLATWDDGAALESFRIADDATPELGRLSARIAAALDAPLESTPITDASVTFNGVVSPWHTVCVVEAPDKPGLLHTLATAIAAAGASVRAARVATEDGIARDRFELTTPGGDKLDEAGCERVRRFIATGVATHQRRWRRARFGPSVPSALPAIANPS
jgi:Kef-type K+ transport system membrane component KefB/glycine cleavage system regulatory protein